MKHESKTSNCNTFSRPTWLKVFETICAAIGILGLFVVAHGEPVQGFLVSSIASVLFIIYNYFTKQWALLIMSAVYFVVEIYGIVNWMTMNR